MSSEVRKYIKTDLNKNENLFNAEVISFPKDTKVQEYKSFKKENYNYWKINDEANYDQLKAVIGVCFMFGALILMGLYSNFL